MNQLEKDRLIEKFMGWELKWMQGYPEMYSGWTFKNSETNEQIEHQYNISVVGFTTDWNWLMKALKRFDSLNIETSNEFIMDKEYPQYCDAIDYAVTLYNIDDAVNALCEGIEWYNSTLN